MCAKQERPPFETGRAWIELNIDNLRHNIQLLRSLLPSGCKLMPAVKANAYGHGAVLISGELSRLGIDTFCVATLREGIELRENGITGDILVLGYTSREELYELRRYDLIQTVVDCDYAKTLNDHGEKLRVHVKADTGMHRLGEWYAHTDNILRIFEYENLEVEGLYTHLCAADDRAQNEYTRLQIDRFYSLVDALKENGISVSKLHIQSSYGVFNCPDLCCDYARIGIAMYGVFSNAGDDGKYSVPLRPVLSIKARVETVKPLAAGESIGYGLQFTAQRDMRMAVIAIGYGDGIPRSLSCGVGSVLIHGRRAPVVGRVCMDRLTVDVTDIPGVNQGDAAVVIGSDGSETISVCDIAAQTSSISNEILSRLGSRLTRITV